MRGTRVKKLRREAYPLYVELLKKRTKGLLSFKSIFRQVKKFYNAGLPIFQDKRVGLSWPTSK